MLVGGFNLSQKYSSNWNISPSRGENKKSLRPPPCIGLPTQQWGAVDLFFFHGAWQVPILELHRNLVQKYLTQSIHTVDGPEIGRENQLRLVVSPIIYRVAAPSQVVSRISEPSAASL